MPFSAATKSQYHWDLRRSSRAFSILPGPLPRVRRRRLVGRGHAVRPSSALPDLLLRGFHRFEKPVLALFMAGAAGLLDLPHGTRDPVGRIFLAVLPHVGHVTIGAGDTRPAVYSEAPRLEVRVLRPSASLPANPGAPSPGANLRAGPLVRVHLLRVEPLIPRQVTLLEPGSK